MRSRNFTWEIVLAGLVFFIIGLYMLDRSDDSDHRNRRAHVQVPHPDAPDAPDAPAPPPLPSSIVIDLQNLGDLKELEKLKNLEGLKNLEIKLKNIDRLIGQKLESKASRESLETSLQQVEQELQKIENADFRVFLKDKKVFINRDYNVKDANWTEVSPGVFVFRKAFDASNLQSLKLKMAFGNLNIVGSNSGKSELLLRATGDMENTRILRERLKVSKTQDGESASLLVTAEGRNLSDQVNLEATLNIPGTLFLDASTGGGHVNANNLDGIQKLFTAGGHIMLDGVSGKVEARTNGGHIKCDKLRGNVNLQTAGGHISVNDSDASLTAKTGGGHIDITDFSGQIEAKTAGGNITAGIQKADGPITLNSSAGNISLTLPENFKADIEARGSSVSIDRSFAFEGNKSKGHLWGKINGGGIPIAISCGYGNVKITND